MENSEKKNSIRLHWQKTNKQTNKQQTNKTNKTKTSHIKFAYKDDINATHCVIHN